MNSPSLVEAVPTIPPAVNKPVLPWRRIAVALVVALTVISATQGAFASQLVLNSTAGTMTLGSDFVLTGSNVATPSGTLSIDCPITNVGGGQVVVYTCTGGSFSFQSTTAW